MKISKPVYLLILLIEECAEIIQRACKAIRFGMEEVQPGQELTNRRRLQDEVNDFYGVDQLLYEAGLSSGVEPGAVDAKKAKVRKYMLYSQNLGILDGVPEEVKAGTPIDEKTMVAGMRVVCGGCQAVLTVGKGYPKIKAHEAARGPDNNLCGGRDFKLYQDFLPPITEEEKDRSFPGRL